MSSSHTSTKRKAADQITQSSTKRHKNARKYHTLLFDIEGTTTSISFVAETLFPYARSNVKAHLERTFSEVGTQKDVQDIAKVEEWDDGWENWDQSQKIDRVVQFVERLMSEDKKQTELKQLQGNIWKAGYESEELKGHLYEDVLPLWQKWLDAGGEIRIYSSGSVAAQKLLFQYSEEGDLLKHISGHYDTKFPGSKLEAASYTKIAEDMGCKPEEILFVTDNVLEAEAAKEAGMPCVVSIRPGTMELPKAHGFETIQSFAELEDKIFE